MAVASYLDPHHSQTAGPLHGVGAACSPPRPVRASRTKHKQSAPPLCLRHSSLASLPHHFYNLNDGSYQLNTLPGAPEATSTGNFSPQLHFRPYLFAEIYVYCKSIRHKWRL